MMNSLILATNRTKLSRVITVGLITVGLIVGLVFNIWIFTGFAANSLDDEVPTREIVVFKQKVSKEKRDEVVLKSGGKKLQDIDLINGSVVELTEKQKKTLKEQPGIERIDPDVVVFAIAQSIPENIIQVQAPPAWATTTGAGIKVGIIDTGIQLNHPDIKKNIKGGINIINPRKSAMDDNGHGTHVAGIVAAINNNIGVVGVAPGVYLYSIKVLNSQGWGFLSDVIKGMEWAVKNKMQVINMSLGTTSDVQSLHDAIIAVKNAGLVIVAAAGNTGGDVTFPAAYEEVLAVSAVDSGNTIASFSSRGPEIDFASPGVSVLSTCLKSTYCQKSGTSMAAPHVTGVVALVLSRPVGIYDVNGNNKWDPDELREKLKNTAIDLGVPGFDNFYGYGLVNAAAAVQ